MGEQLPIDLADTKAANAASSQGRMRRCGWTLAAAAIGAALLPAAAAASRPPAPAANANAPRWTPSPGTTWQWQIVDRIGRLRSVDMYDVDLTGAIPSRRDVRVPGVGRAHWPRGVNSGIVHRLHRHGMVAVCYLDSGAWESYEPDAKLFPKGVIGGSTGFNGEHWLDIRRRSRGRFASIIWARLRLAKAIGCDAVEPDENNPLGNHPGFPISRGDERSWYLAVAHQAHRSRLRLVPQRGVLLLPRVRPRGPVHPGLEGRVSNRVHRRLAKAWPADAEGSRASRLSPRSRSRLLDARETKGS